ncbi:hypothetical protein MSG28_012000 [Choristoneura fumiferana]|uniref:Uncharacterized protein n=1 Tax=Choristoneura fumiferana TaxID=7141 RepID=A0ACC0KMK9_CHOFU|nr:hypothetical protein MSG28_012000 [Choristoneura fumiferana]
MSRKNTIKKSLDFSRSDHMDIALSMLMSSSESEHQGISEAPLPLEPYDEKSLQSRPDEALQGTYREPAYNMDPLGKMLRKNWPQQRYIARSLYMVLHVLKSST